MTRIGILSDTHGLLRPEVLEALAGVDCILHAGDVGDPKVLTSLEGLAPVVAVRGNTDRGAWAEALPATAVAEFGSHLFYVIHDLEDLDLDPQAAGLRAVVSGHTHLATVRETGGVLFVNPGSVGPRRAAKPVTLAVAELEGDLVEVRIIPLL